MTLPTVIDSDVVEQYGLTVVYEITTELGDLDFTPEIISSSSISSKLEVTSTDGVTTAGN